MAGRELTYTENKIDLGGSKMCKSKVHQFMPSLQSQEQGTQGD